MPRTITIETVNEFVRRNNGETIASSSGNWLLCPNGAKLTHDGQQRHEPSQDPVQILSDEWAYLEALVKKLDRLYVQLQNNLIQQTNWFVMNSANLPGEDGLTALSEVTALLSQKTEERNTKQAEYEQRRGPTRAEIQA